MAKEPRAVYRTLLRAINKNITRINGDGKWEEFVKAQFRRNLGREEVVQRQWLAQASDYARLIDNIRENRELMLSYNIGIPVDQRERDMNAKAAQYVGLQMPPKSTEGTADGT
jgi:hypothetical protein